MENYINSLKTISEVNKYRESINEQCDERIDVLKTIEKANGLSNKSFGYIKECFESLSPVLFNTNEGKKLINKYTKTISESKDLSSLHRLHETIRKAGKDTDVDFLMKSISETDWNINKKSVNESVEKLGKVLAEAYIVIGQDVADEYIPKNDEKLYSAINYIAENGLSNKNLIEYSDAVKVIKENILNKEGQKNVFEQKDLDSLANELLEEFNKKYSDKISDEEASVLKEIASSEDRKSVFNKYKESCLSKITEAKKKFDADGDTKSSERLGNVMEQINGKSYCLETVGEDICKLIELSNIFEE